jgi:hypothetical protein
MMPRRHVPDEFCLTEFGKTGDIFCAFCLSSSLSKGNSLNHLQETEQFVNYTV